MNLKNRTIFGWVRQLESFSRFMHTFFLSWKGSFLKIFSSSDEIAAYGTLNFFYLQAENYRGIPKFRKLLKHMNYSHEKKNSQSFSEQNLFLIFHLSNIKPSAKPSAKKLLPPKQKQKEKKLLPSAEASAFGPPLQ